MKLPGGRTANIPPPRLRQEIFSLGGRHQGDALAGARIELKEQDLTAERRALLREVVSHLSPNSRAPADAATPLAKPARFVDILYLIVIFAAASWIAVILGRL
jgi:hypothetical protein